MNFYEKAGPAALGSRLRRLGEVLLNESEKLYQLYDVDIDPRWFPVFFMLMEKETAAITELAEDIGQTHPAVSQVVSSMIKHKIVTTRKSPDDGRVKQVMLTDKGRQIANNLQLQCQDVEQTVLQLFDETSPRFWFELEAVEQALQQQDLYSRVSSVRKKRAQEAITLVPYTPQYQNAYRDLNVAWIEQYFEMEESDYKALDTPQSSILDKGGYIVIAVMDDNPIGTCALIKMSDDRFELAKMTVSTQCRGMGVGEILGEHCLNYAKQKGARSVFLESNTALGPAIKLYRKLGFKPISGGQSPYSRCNIQMELLL